MSTPQPVPDGVSAMSNDALADALEFGNAIVSRNELARRLRGGLGAAGAKETRRLLKEARDWIEPMAGEVDPVGDCDDCCGVNRGKMLVEQIDAELGTNTEPAPPARPDSTLAEIAAREIIASLGTLKDRTDAATNTVQRAIDAATRGLVEENKKLRDAVDAGWWAMEFYLDDQGNYGWEISDNREDHMKKTMRTMKAALAPSGGKGAE